MSRKGPRNGASSASAAAAVGGIAPTFTSFAAATAAVLEEGGAAAAVSEWDASALQILKGASKKDATTRVRALTELCVRIENLPDTRSDEFGIPFINAWGSQFSALAADPVPGVRISAVETMACTVVKFTRLTQPILRNTLAHWVACLGDSVSAVVSAAEKSLERAFPSETVGMKLVGLCGNAMLEYCMSGVRKLRLSGDEGQIQRILAVAKWTIDTSRSLDHMKPFVDEDLLLRLGVGVKTSKAKVAPLAAPKAACVFAADSVLPLLDLEVKNDLSFSRACRIADLSVASISAGELAGWDLLLTLLEKGWHKAFGDWQHARNAFKKSLTPPTTGATFAAILPFFMLLPAHSETSTETVNFVFSLLRSRLLPESDQASEAAGVKFKASGIASYRVDALPAYLECLKFTCETGAFRWTGSLEPRELSQYACDYVEPVLIEYLSGKLLPPHSSEAGTAVSRLSCRAPAHEKSSDTVSRRFAEAVVALDAKNVASLIQNVTQVVVPICGGSIALARRLVNVVKNIRSADSDVGISFIRNLVDNIVPCNTNEDTPSVAHLFTLAELFEDLEDSSYTPVDAEGLINFAIRGFERCTVGDVQDAVGHILSWIAIAGGFVTSSLVLQASLGLCARSYADGVILFKAVLLSHKNRRRNLRSKQDAVTNVGGDKTSPCFEGRMLDEFVCECASKFGSEELPDRVRSALSELLELLVDDASGAVIAIETRRTVVCSVHDFIASSDNADSVIALISSLLRHSSSLSENCEAVLHLVSAFVTSGYDTNALRAETTNVGILDEFLEDLDSSLLADLNNRVSEAIGERLVQNQNAFSEAERLGQRWARVFVGCRGIRDFHSFRADVMDLVAKRLSDQAGELQPNFNANDVTDMFGCSALVVAGPLKVIHDSDEEVSPGRFICEYRRALALEAKGWTSSASPAKLALLQFMEEAEPLVSSAISRTVVKLVLQMSKPVTDTSHLDIREFMDQRDVDADALLELLGRAIRADENSNRNAVGIEYAVGTATPPSLESAAAAARILNGSSARIVRVCCSSSRRGLYAFRNLFEDAVTAIRRDSETTLVYQGMAVLAAVLDTRKYILPSMSDSGGRTSSENDFHTTHRDAPASSEILVPDWFVELLRRALYSIRRARESHALTSSASYRGSGALLVASAVRSGFQLSDDDWRFWSLAALDALRGIQVLDGGSVGECVIEDTAAMAELSAAMALEQNVSGRSIGASVDEMAHHGAWAAAKLMGVAPLRLLPAFSKLVLVAAKRNVLKYQDDETCFATPSIVYGLLPQMASEDSTVRRAVFVLTTAIGILTLPAAVEKELPPESLSDEDVDYSSIAKIIPSAIAEALEWSQGVGAHNGTHSEATFEELRFFLSWLFFLHLIRSQDSRQRSSNAEDRSLRRVGVSFLRSRPEVYADFFSRCIQVVIDGTRSETSAATIGASASLETPLLEWVCSEDNSDDGSEIGVLVGRYAGAALALALQSMPALSRQHVADHVEHGLALQVEEFVKRRISTFLIGEEIRKVREWSDGGSQEQGGGEGQLAARGSVAGREVWATYTLSEVKLEVVLRIPEAFPLHTVQVDDSDGNWCVGMGKTKWRKTLLGMNTLLRFKDGSLAEAVELWRRNLDKTFQGVEECPICYSVLHLVAGTLPKMQCRTCKNMYHSECLFKWFKTSPSRTCPMCRSAF